jgi:integrase
LGARANLLDPESVKETIANQPLTETTKRNYTNTYDAFAKIMGIHWKKPNYKPNTVMPFIPLESEIDQVIYGTGKKLSAALRIAKETAMRIGEIVRLRWTDVDHRNKVIVINKPEKGSKAGIYKVSNELMSMIMSLPKTSEKIFPTSVKSLVSRFCVTRKRLARKYNNPRLLRITFHTLRHWKATLEYHKTKDILHVKELLRHRNIENTMIYINLEKLLFKTENDEEFHARVAKNIEEACELVKSGFEYVTEYKEGKIFRKRK